MISRDVHQNNKRCLLLWRSIQLSCGKSVASPGYECETVFWSLDFSRFQRGYTSGSANAFLPRWTCHSTTESPKHIDFDTIGDALQLTVVSRYSNDNPHRRSRLWLRSCMWFHRWWAKSFLVSCFQWQSLEATFFRRELQFTATVTAAHNRCSQPIL